MNSNDFEKFNGHRSKYELLYTFFGIGANIIVLKENEMESFKNQLLTFQFICKMRIFSFLVECRIYYTLFSRNN